MFSILAPPAKASVYDYSITDIKQTTRDTIVVSAQCLFCSGCNPNDPGWPDRGTGCTPFGCGYPPASFPSYVNCQYGSPDGRYAAIRLKNNAGTVIQTQKLVCDTSNWPLNTLWSHNFIFSGLTFTPGETITVEADFYCSYCYHWYATPQSFVPVAYTIVYVPLNWQGDLNTFDIYVSSQNTFLINNVDALTDLNTEILTVDENLVLDFDKTSNGWEDFAGWFDIFDFAVEHGETGDRYVAITNENIWGFTDGLSTLYGTVAVVDVSTFSLAALEPVTSHELGHTWGLLDEYNYQYWQDERDWVLMNMPQFTAYNSYPVEDNPDLTTCNGRSFGILGLGRCIMGPIIPGLNLYSRGYCPECHPIVEDHIFRSWGYWSWGLAEVVVTFFKNGTAPEVERITGIPVAGKSMCYAGPGNYGVQVFSEAGGLLFNSNISYSFLLAPSQTENGTAMPMETDAIKVAWLVPAFSERKITVVLKDNIADQIITSQEVVLAPIDEAWIDYETTDKTNYDFGDTIEVTTEVETNATSMDIILDVTLLDPNNVAQDYRSWTGTIHPGPDPIARYLMIPSSGITGTWTVYVVVLNSTGHFQDSESNFITVGLPTDTMPPTTTLTIGFPQHIDYEGNMYVTSATTFTLTAEDNLGGSGVASTFYHIYNNTYDADWLEYSAPFHLTSLSDGEYSIDYYSKDNIGNTEPTNTTTVILENICAIINLDPHVLNLKSKSQWFTARIEIPATYHVSNYTASDINMNSLRLNQTIPIDPTAPMAIGDFDENGILDLMVEFNRTTISEFMLAQGIVTGNVTLTISGELNDGTSFEGSAIIVARMPGDVNMDGKVDLFDAITAANHFGCCKGDSEWSSVVDEDENGLIDIFDLILISRNFGKP